MCSSFYGLGLLPMGEEERQQGDLADMVRSSINNRNIYSHYVSDSNSNQILLGTASVAAEDDQEESCVDYRIISSDHQFLSSLDDDSLFLPPSSATTADHLPTIGSSMIIKSRDGVDGVGGASALHLSSYNSSLGQECPSTSFEATAGAADTCINAMDPSLRCVRLKSFMNCNIFTQMLHVSSSSIDQNQNILQGPVHPSSFTLGCNEDDHILTTRATSKVGMMPQNCNQNKSCTTATASYCDTLLHVSSHRDAASKRRKSQAKKVVCVPAPAPANNRPASGEIVPSDLWAWRKYGQKPIKGSPYPRGYYRCSSSKGCPARKQVERSRTDSKMLVIAYTSEHNHPWPTQRNALAGSTRSHPSKNTTTNSSSSWTGVVADDHMKHTNNGGEHVPAADMIIKPQKVDDHCVVTSVLNDQDYSNTLTYKPRPLDIEEYNEQSQDDFFADLGEIVGKEHDIFLMDWTSSQDHAR